MLINISRLVLFNAMHYCQVSTYIYKTKHINFFVGVYSQEINVLYGDNTS